MNMRDLELTSFEESEKRSNPRAAIEPHVQLKNLCKRLGSLQAVDNVSLDIPRGNIVTLLGPSGCGKSTTLRLLAGLYSPDSGDILLGGQRMNDFAPNRRRMTMVFQEYALFPHLSVADNVAYGLKMRSVAEDRKKARVGEMLELVGLSSEAAKHPHQLSGGQQQRVALARALAVDPEVLLLDEPLSNLDAKLRVRLREEIVKLQKVLGKTMVFVTHDQEEALSISDRIAVMERGRVAQMGTPDEIYYAPTSRYVADFIGLANFMDVEVNGVDSVHLGGASVPVKTRGMTGPATLMVRPEAVRITAGDIPGATGLLKGTVHRRSFLGSMARYWVEVAGVEWMVDDPSPAGRVHEGEVFLQLTTERLHLLPRA